jgi:hypothetical protein
VELRIPKLRKGSHFQGFSGAQPNDGKGSDYRDPRCYIQGISTFTRNALVRAGKTQRRVVSAIVGTSSGRGVVFGAEAHWR